jgi:hypothetical protein
MAKKTPTPPATTDQPTDQVPQVATDYQVLSPVEFDGDRYEVGELVALTEEHAVPLLKVAAIALPPEPAAT